MARNAWLAALNKQKIEVKAASNALTTKGWLDTGNFALNYAISGRFLLGYPLGHTVEIFGDPSCGKSYLLARAIAMAQAQGGVGLLDDIERAYSLPWLDTLGVNTDELGLPNPCSTTVEEHLKVTQAFIAAFKSGNWPCGVVGLDSIAQLTTAHEQKVQLEKKDMSKAIEMKAFFRIVGAPLSDIPVVHISCNHVYDNIGNPFVKRSTSGGKGSRYMATVRLDMRMPNRIKMAKDSMDYWGVLVRIHVDKNRVAPPWKEVSIAIPFHQPISRASGLIRVLTKLQVLAVDGSDLSYKGESIGRDYNDKPANVIHQDEQGEGLLDKFPEILEEVDKALMEGKLNTGVRGSADSVEVEGDDTENEESE